MYLLQTFPLMERSFGTSTMFGFYSICSITLGILVIYIVPETKEKSMEEIQNYFETKGKKQQNTRL